MEARFELEYFAAPGERLALETADGRLPMADAGGGRWVSCTAAPAPGSAYGYVVLRDGAVVRREWRPHRMPEVGEAVVRCCLHDRWQDPAPDEPFRSSAFTEGIFRREAEPGAVPLPAPVAGEVELRVEAPAVRPGETVALAAGSDGLGAWQSFRRLDDAEFPVWRLTLRPTEAFDYKFVLLDRASGRLIAWEEGENRRLRSLPQGDEIQIVNCGAMHLPQRRWRGAGVAVPVFSLRSAESFGVGEFADLERLVDWAAATGLRVIQLLPVNDTTMRRTWRDSYPYNAVSSFALHPQYIRLEEADARPDEALRRELNALPEVDYERVNAAKRQALEAAYARTGGEVLHSAACRTFLAENAAWLVPYAVFCVLRDRYATAEFGRWPELSVYDEAGVQAFYAAHAREAGLHVFIQYHLHRQLRRARAYAHRRGVVLKGDLPIGISRTSVDAWQWPGLFRMDAQAGAPPDAFAAEGQNWGFPTYDWEAMARDDYAWWRARFAKMADYFDAYRIDHILGFFRIWEIPRTSRHGLLGHFSPALPYATGELRAAGLDPEALSRPPLTERALIRYFGSAVDRVRREYVTAGRLAECVATQQAVEETFRGEDPVSQRLREGFMALLDDVLFVEDPRCAGHWHPRIGGAATVRYELLPAAQRQCFDRLHDEFFYRRHNAFWRAEALRKLPRLVTATRMLACGEDLGMIPACVPEVMEALRILSLEVERMPKRPGEAFADPAAYPYFSVCTTSTHDTSTLREWWEELPAAERARYLREALHDEGPVPAHCTPQLAQRIVERTLAGGSMLAILPLQDWLALDGALRREDAAAERINVPADGRHYWRYRMHIDLGTLLGTGAFNVLVREMVARSGRE